MYISIADLMLVTFCLADDWYQRKGARLLVLCQVSIDG